MRLPLPILFASVLPFTLVLAFDTRSKRGLAWPNGNWVPLSGFTHPSSRISSYYNWTPDPLPIERINNLPNPNPFPFVPMLWGCSPSYVDPFLAAVSRNFDGRNLTRDKAILAFNEPDLGAQANCSPRDAAEVWRRVLQPLKQLGYRIGSPSVTNGPDGRKWLDEWWAACEGGCDPDFMTVHWYDVDVGRFMNHIKEYRAAYNRPIWVTEYAPTNFTFSSTGALIGTQPSYAQIERFMDVTNSWMDGVDWIERYFWFGAMYEMQGVVEDAILLDPRGKPTRTGALSALGVQYAGSNGTSLEAAGGNGAQPSTRPRVGERRQGKDLLHEWSISRDLAGSVGSTRGRSGKHEAVTYNSMKDLYRLYKLAPDQSTDQKTLPTPLHCQHFPESNPRKSNSRPLPPHL